MIVHEIILKKSIGPTKSISDKKAKCTKREFLELFYDDYFFSQLYRSKSATLEIAYDMKIDSLLCII